MKESILGCLLILFAGLGGITVGYNVGQESGKEQYLEKCKQAGWEFVDDLFMFARKSKKDQSLTQEALTKEAWKERMYLHSKISTDCIVRFSN